MLNPSRWAASLSEGIVYESYTPVNGYLVGLRDRLIVDEVRLVLSEGILADLFFQSPSSKLSSCSRLRSPLVGLVRVCDVLANS